MDREEVIHQYFTRRGFRVEWVWMSSQAPFLLVWKARRVLVYYVDLTGQLSFQKSNGIRDAFLNLLSHLNRLPQKDDIFKGREMDFRWLLPGEPTLAQREILREAGVEPFSFRFPPL